MTEDVQFELLLEMLKRDRGFDFTGYKRSSLMRRVSKRMKGAGIESYADYADFLEVHPDEFDELFNTILINVTSFLRDPEAWEALRTKVLIPLSERDPLEKIRVWSAGCASGQETYTIVMMLAELLGIERFQQQVKVYATDADENALAKARLAKYSARDLELLPEEWRSKYFEPNGDGLGFRADLRRCVIFGEHDLVQDAPISRLDLLICRNTMIYFNAETQERILSRFHFALQEGGHLFLGRSEMLLSHSRLFAVVDLGPRIFSKVSGSGSRVPLSIPETSKRDRVLAALQDEDVQLRDYSFRSGFIAQIVVDQSGIIALANDQARVMFRLTSGDIGRPLQDLELSYRPVELRSRIDRAYETGQPVTITDIEYFLPHAHLGRFDVQVTPLRGPTEEHVGCSIIFVDVTTHHDLRVDLERSGHALETAYEELQASSEELETTNEELQSTIEELETTNEELQSSNEELETMNEELQSTNNELEIINDEATRRTIDLNEVTDFMAAIMTSIHAGVVVADTNLNILLWNAKAEDLWGLRAAEVEGRSLMTLEFGLPLDHLTSTMRSCLDGKIDFAEQVLEATNRRGRKIQCRVTCNRMVSPDKKPRGLLLFMEELKSATP